MNKFIIVFLILIVLCSHKQIDNKQIDLKKIEKRTKIKYGLFLINRFPKIIKPCLNDDRLQRLNSVLESRTRLNTIRDASTSLSNEKKNIISDYNILEENDSLVSFEFFLKKGNKIYIYSTTTYNKHKCKLMSCEEVVPNVEREKLKKYIDIYFKKLNIRFSTDSYNKNENTELTYSKKGKIFILYAGDEGEGHGYYKIQMPLDSVVKK